MKLSYDKFIAYLALLSGLSISAVAIYYSVAGLVSIFAAAAIPIVIMGIVLESGKLVATLWLKQYWTIAPKAIRAYLLAAVFILMTITSMGIFGYLSKAHLDQAVPTGDVAAKVSIIDEKIKTQQANIESARKALAQLDASVDQVMARSTTEAGATKANQIRKAQAKERSGLQSDIASAQKEIAKLNDERAPVAAELRKVEAEVGPIKYIAALIYGDTLNSDLLERAVRWVIILIVVIFDPLAIVLLLASQYSFQWFRQQPVEEPKTETKSDNIEPVEEPEYLGECPECGTELLNAPGIGPFCPNKDCDVADGPFVVDKITVISPSVADNKPTTITTDPDDFDISKHPYLFAAPGLRHPPGIDPVPPQVFRPEVVFDTPLPSITPDHIIDSQPEPGIDQEIVEEVGDLERPGDYVLEQEPVETNINNTADTANSPEPEVKPVEQSYITKEQDRQIKMVYVQNSEQSKKSLWSKIDHKDDE